MREVAGVESVSLEIALDVFDVATEQRVCIRVRTGIDPKKREAIEAHADFVANLMVPQNG